MSLLTYQDSSHSYWLEGQEVPSVTRCTSVVAKPALIGWAARQAASWAADNPDQLAELGRDTFVKEAARAHTRARDTAGQVGRDLHSYAEKLATTGEAPDVPAAALPMVRQAADFLDALQVDTIASERAVYHDTFSYAGRFDLVAAIRGEVWLLDFKTSASGVWPDMALQASAYRFATHMQQADPHRDDLPMPPIAHVGIVWVRPEGWQLIPLRADRDAWQAFLATIPLWHFAQQTRAQVVLPAAAMGEAGSDD